MLNIIYRISNTGYNKVKPTYINNKNCLNNALFIFNKANWRIIADNVNDETKEFLNSKSKIVEHVSVGHGAGTFNLALDYALTLPDNEIVYFLENDYLHKPESDKVLEEGFKLGSDYVALYDHPDKYMDDGNPFVEGGGEVTKVFLSNSCHWKLTNSTTMTFAAKVKTLREDEEILRKYTSGKHPYDFQMFLELRNIGRTLITPIPGYSTHGETTWLTPLINWNDICNYTLI
jgi:hypothetical protein